MSGGGFHQSIECLNLTYFGAYTFPAATNIHYAVDFSSANGSRLVQDTIEDVRFGSPKGFVGVRQRPQPHTCLEMSRGNILYASHCPKVRSTPIVTFVFSSAVLSGCSDDLLQESVLVAGLLGSLTLPTVGGRWYLRMPTWILCFLMFGFPTSQGTVCRLRLSQCPRPSLNIFFSLFTVHFALTLMLRVPCIMRQMVLPTVASRDPG